MTKNVQKHFLMLAYLREIYLLAYSLKHEKIGKKHIVSLFS